MARTVTEEIRYQIEKSGKSLYRISLDAGIGHTTLGRFINEGADMKGSNLDKLADYFDLELTKRKK